MYSEVLKDDIRKAKKKWSYSAIFGLVLLHAATMYVLYRIIAVAIPRFSFESWILFGIFGGMSIVGIIGLTITYHLHRGYGGRIVDGKYKREKIPRSLERADTFGLVNTVVGLTGMFALFSLFGFSAFYAGNWALAGILLVVSGLGVTIGYHRYATHRSFECGKIFGTCLLFAGAMNFQGFIRTWVVNHLVHHARTEIEQEDPHTPREGFWHSHMGWVIQPYVHSKKVTEMFSRGIENNKLLLQQRKYYAVAIASGLIAPFLTLLVWAVWNRNDSWLLAGIDGLLLAGVFRVTLSLHVIWSVNSFSHIWGRHRYENEVTGDSTDVWILAPFSFGENLQNIHHLLPSCAYYGINWWYKLLDISGNLILFFAWLNRFKFLRWAGFPYRVKVLSDAQWKYIREHTIPIAHAETVKAT